MDQQVIYLESISIDDLRSPLSEHRKMALESLARNECKVFGKVTQQTAEDLLRLEHEPAAPILSSSGSESTTI
jgi:hypothetical protein